MSNEKPPYPSRTADQFVVRFPDGMRDRLKEAAHANGRSMNAEIVARLQLTFDQDPALGLMTPKQRKAVLGSPEFADLMDRRLKELVSEAIADQFAQALQEVKERYRGNEAVASAVSSAVDAANSAATALDRAGRKTGAAPATNERSPVGVSTRKIRVRKDEKQ